jgi:hypothetical protein
MPNCYEAQGRLINPNKALILVPIACPGSSGGQPDLVALEGQTSTSINLTGGTTSVRSKSSGAFDEFSPTVVGGEVSCTVQAYKAEYAPAQWQTINALRKQTTVGVVFSSGDKSAVAASDLYAKGHVTGVTINAGLDEGNITIDLTIQLTGKISNDAANIAVAAS